MNIIILTYLFYPEPIVMSTITEDLAIELSKEHNVTVVTSKPCRPYGYTLPIETTKPNWRFNRVILDSYTHPKSDLIGRLKENRSFGNAAKHYIQEHHNEIDIIYMNVFPLFAQKKVIKTAKKYGIKTINHVEDIYPEPFRQKVGVVGKILYNLLLPMDKWILNNASYSVVIGPKIREYLMRTRKIAGDNIKIVYNWQDESRFLTNLEQTKKPNSSIFTFMYVGSISRAAGLQCIIEAFVRANISNAKLVFAGSGTEKESLISECSKYSNARIDFIDAPFQKIAEIQSQADVLILPLLKGVSLRAVPSKLPAYLFSHKAVIACVEEESDVADIITRGHCGWITPPERVEHLAELMKVVSKIPQYELQRMGENGFVFSQNNLTQNVNLKKLTTLITNHTVKNEYSYI